jgi:large subunit ribosomal protein L5
MATTKKTDSPRFHKEYVEKIRPMLLTETGKKNVNQVPKLTKIVVSMGVGAAINDNAILRDAAEHLAVITGQKPILTKAGVSISNFKLREGVQIGCKVTLRGERMYDFLERLICVALPGIRDFRGVSSRAFDGRGNYSLGIDEQLVFPEVNPDSVKRTQGMNIALVTTADNDDDGRALLKAFGMPFRV